MLSKIAPAANVVPDSEHLEGFRRSQRLAMECAREISKLIAIGWSEQQVAALMETYLRDRGVKSFFHHPFVWFGERTRFDNVSNYAQYAPSNRVLLENEVFILDVAPILDGYICDIGYTTCQGNNARLKKAMAFLQELRAEIPNLFVSGRSGAEIWGHLHERIVAAGYENIHKKYPFSVLGHRVHFNIPQGRGPKLWNFGWQSYWSLLSRGLFGQLLNQDHQGDLVGLWAIEPHIGVTGPAPFGAKFEEILVVEKDRAYWLENA